MNQEDGVARLKAITADLQGVIENHLGTGFITGNLSPSERAEKISTGVVASSMLMQRLVALALYQKLEKAPSDPVACKVFVDKMVQDMTAMLHQRMDMLVAEAMEQIAYAVLSQVTPGTTEH